MQIIIKQDFISNTEDVINIFYGENNEYVADWINAYFEQEIESLKMMPCEDNIRPDSLDYFVEMENNMFYLVKKYKQILKGYIYNTSEKISEKLYSIRYLTFDNVNVVLDKVNESSSLWNGINSEITHRVMRQVDQDSLYRINLNFEAAIKTKENWNSTELIMMRNEITKTYKKELYSSIVKKMKRFEKKQNKKASPNNVIPCKTIMIDENGLRGCGGMMPDLSKYSGTSCSLEYQIVNNKQKYE
jgi:hypothetical protein